ncbi:hypothetical protein EHO60_02240 [Leptospira fletcheri]|uniref:Uncharacterized protein n=1 Tax=Leptospira fletcheri TaxID=2484981 RepID=A0A4R9GJ15_9LEPT|nr:hypothetical protein [Leptospira fletcheri]TGK13042.1 hypothetical protein EHO60_02240 [Leptospira fletcheri]
MNEDPSALVETAIPVPETKVENRILPPDEETETTEIENPSVPKKKGTNEDPSALAETEIPVLETKAENRILPPDEETETTEIENRFLREKEGIANRSGLRKEDPGRTANRSDLEIGTKETKGKNALLSVLVPAMETEKAATKDRIVPKRDPDLREGVSAPGKTELENRSVPKEKTNPSGIVMDFLPRTRIDTRM